LKDQRIGWQFLKGHRIGWLILKFLGNMGIGEAATRSQSLAGDGDAGDASAAAAADSSFGASGTQKYNPVFFLLLIQIAPLLLNYLLVFVQSCLPSLGSKLLLALF
jgi:hypothetical protein